MAIRFNLEGWSADPDRNTLTREGVAHPIHPSHMRVLLHLAEHAHQPVDKTLLLEKGWESSNVSEDNLSVAVSHLRRELGDDLEEPRLICEVSDRNYELFTEVTWDEDASSLQWQRFPKLLLAILVLMALGMKWLEMRIGNEEQPLEVNTRIESVAVLPLLFVSERKQETYLADGVTNWIFDEMSHWKTPDLIALSSTKRLGPEPDFQSLGVDAIISGRLLLADKRLELSMRLSESSGKLIWEKTYKGEPDNLLSFTQECLATLFPLLHPEELMEPQATPARQPDAKVFHDYLKASWLRKTGDPQQAADMFADLIIAAPDFAKPYMGLAQARLLLAREDSPVFERELPVVKNLLERAINLDKKYVEAYLLLGSLQFFDEWDFPNAHANFKKALNYGPNNANAHFQLARFSVAFGRNETSYSLVKRLKKLDPLAYSKSDVAWIFNMMSRFDESLAELNLLEAENPDDKSLTGAYLRTYELMDQEEKAFEQYVKLFERLAYSEKERDEARQAFETGRLVGLNKWLIHEKFEQGDVGQFEPPLAIARFCAAANEKEWAFTWLEMALSRKQVALLWINMDRKYDNLVSDPKFLDITRRIGLDYRISDQETR